MKWLIAHSTDIVLAPFTFLSSVLLKMMRRLGVSRMPISKGIFNRVGVFPIRDHYFEPMFNTTSLKKSLQENRCLPGIDLNIAMQLEVLDKFDFNEELKSLPIDRQKGQASAMSFYYHNKNFESGDAEYLYNMIRLYKPSTLIEIGAGFSTLLAREAINKNLEVDPSYNCEHICIEPYENEWLDGLGVKMIREPVQNVDRRLFRRLKENDILFIDSSHMIRPQGDVLFEYLEVLPSLNSGVLVHAHDIFTPRDYPDEWIREAVLFWNEQYLLEAFLSLNDQFKIIGALNFLAHNYRSKFAAKCPIYELEASYREPGSFWIVRT